MSPGDKRGDARRTLNAAATLIGDGEFQRARALLEPLLGQSQLLPRAWSLVVRCDKELGDRASHESHLREWARRSPPADRIQPQRLLAALLAEGAQSVDAEDDVVRLLVAAIRRDAAEVVAIAQRLPGSVALPADLELDIAGAANRVGRYDIAKDAMKRFESASEPTTRSLRLKAETLFQMGRFEDAQGIFEALLGDKQEDYLYDRLHVCLVKRDSDPARRRALVERWSAAFPDSSKALKGRFDVAAAERDALTVLATFKTMEERGTVSAREYSLVAEVAADHPTEALRLLERGIQRFPSVRFLREQTASAQFQEGQFEAARRSLAEFHGVEEEGVAHQLLFGRQASTTRYLIPEIMSSPIVQPGAQLDPGRTFACLADILLATVRILKRRMAVQGRETPGLYPFGAANAREASEQADQLAAAARILAEMAVRLQRNELSLAALADAAHEGGDDGVAAAVRQEISEQGAVVDPGHWTKLATSLLRMGRIDGALEAARKASSPTPLAYAPFRPYGVWADDRAFDAAPAPIRRLPLTAYIDRDAHRVDVEVTSPVVAGRVVEDATLVLGTTLLNKRGEVLLQEARDLKFPDERFVAAAGFDGAIIKSFAPKGQITNGFVLGGSRTHYLNYFHGLIQNIGRIPEFQRSGALEGRKVLLPSGTPSWFRGVLSFFGIGEDAVVAVDENAINLRDCFIANPPQLVDIPAEETLKTFRDAVFGRLPRTSEPTERIFLTRFAAKNYRRLLINVHELADIAVRAGLTLVDPSTMAFEEQIALFSRARLICGPSGAAFANCIFAPRGTAVVCLAARESGLNHIAAFSSALGQDFRWCLGRAVPEGRASRRFPQVPYAVEAGSFRKALADAMDDERS